ncbi:hypothetical protein [Microvirga zambiensis]|uniref:hypothetical protein n=1 Tax=Microvirga zambiensis TaxID=1402137 RepID=UPI00191F5858|nr:hypothetical protein [Microvirga zambiensis]
MRDEAQIRSDLTAIAAAEKAMATNPDWQITTKQGADHLAIACPLAIDGVIVSGLRLEVFGPQAVPASRSFYGLSAHLFAVQHLRNWHLCRIEFDPENPLKPHRNPLGSHGAPPIVRGPHIHPFLENAALGVDALTPEGNLPIAFPIKNELATFDDILDIIRTGFNVPGLWLEEPTWSRMLV